MPLDFVPITKWLNMQKMSNEGDIQNYGCQSLDTYIFSNKECEEISNYILKLVKDFGDKLGYQYEDYKFTQSWLTWKYPGQSHTSHTHANSLISGVFYYDYVDQNTPSIIFSDKLIYGLLPLFICLALCPKIRVFSYFVKIGNVTCLSS